MITEKPILKLLSIPDSFLRLIANFLPVEVKASQFLNVISRQRFTLILRNNCLFHGKNLILEEVK